eukprot:gnl/TRDRNA2_/TRDRNA2_44794_c0_seq1.p1 gnl/TRDRNA2_/TRDRNA2_44794_c0~~gnl/TRDRNA2_/TRDRNA2_44794_c0_seq1.p1  ORF type:complete len:269 (-),score=62.14 gnl/TRDRNA2_/TRDRNA2_44794_c0_seq1:104-910(-)
MAPPSSRVASMLALDGQCALITGASSGIGAHLAAVLHEAGADVVLCARRTDRLEELAAELDKRRGSKGSAQVVAMDVADTAAVRSAFQEAKKKMAGRVCDVVVNCSGIAMPKKAVDVPQEEYDALMNVNQRGAFVVCQEAARHMMDAKVKGSIICVASILGIRQNTMQTTYGMSKAAVIHMAKVMSLEWVRQGVRVNVIAPGYFPTEMNSDFLETETGKSFINRTPAKRAGQLSELDGATLMLASDKASSWITGVCVPVDGGHLLSSL